MELLKDSILSIYIDTTTEMENNRAVRNKLNEEAQTKDNKMKEEFRRGKYQSYNLSFDSLNTAEFDIDSWDLNIAIIDGGQCSRLVGLVFKATGLLESFSGLNEVFSSFISKVQFFYTFHGNPFHNFNHGTGGNSLVLTTSLSFNVLFHNKN